MQFLDTSSPTSVRVSLDRETQTGIASLKSLDSSSTHSTETNSTASLTADESSHSSTRRVRFHPLVRAKDTISRYDMTDDEITRCFLQEEDYIRIYDHNQRILRRANKYHSKGKPLPESAKLKGLQEDVETTKEGKFVCTRGLEPIMRSYRLESILTVLEEQNFQIIEGYYDEEHLAAVYAEANEQCKFRAVCLAMEDRMSVASEQ